MTSEHLSPSEISRRSLLTAAGLGTAVVALESAAVGPSAAASPRRSRRAGTFDPAATPPVTGLHTQFGADAATEVTVSLQATQVVAHPRIYLARNGHPTSVPSNGLFFDPPACRVIVSVTAPDPTTGKRAPVHVHEDAPWSAVRDAAHSYGFAAFEVDPGDRRGGTTTITVTRYDVVGPYGQVQPFETFTLRRPRSDGR